jgi:hypothetical protein
MLFEKVYIESCCSHSSLTLAYYCQQRWILWLCRQYGLLQESLVVPELLDIGKRRLLRWRWVRPQTTYLERCARYHGGVNWLPSSRVFLVRHSCLQRGSHFGTTRRSTSSRSVKGNIAENKGDIAANKGDIAANTDVIAANTDVIGRALSTKKKKAQEKNARHTTVPLTMVGDGCLLFRFVEYLSVVYVQ